MRYPKLTILLTCLALVLGEAAVADRTHESALFRTVDAVAEMSGEVITRVDWRLTRVQAARGDACATGRVALAHYHGHRLVDFDYSGLQFDRKKAAELFRRAAELGCDEYDDAVLFYDLDWPDQLAPFRDDEGRVQWDNVVAASSTGDPDARFFVATTMRQSPNRAERRGIQYNPERGTAMLKQLAKEGHMDALLEVARDGSGITQELNRAYYALMNTTWRPLPSLHIHLRLLQTAIKDCNPSAWAKAMDIWSTLGLDVRASERANLMLGDAHERYLSTCSGPGR